MGHLGQSIQYLTKVKFVEDTFKKFEVLWSAKVLPMKSLFLVLSFTYKTYFFITINTIKL